MPTAKSPRKGSLQFWPRKRASKFLPRVNWSQVSSSSPGVSSFIGYKVGMKSALVRDETEHSMTKGKRIIAPVTIIECPPMKLFSVRMYKDGKVATEVILSEGIKADAKELKKRVRLPAQAKKLDSLKAEDYDDVHVITYSLAKKTNLKKTPDLLEMQVQGDSTSAKLAWVKEHIGKEIALADVLSEGNLVDIRGLTKGKGLQGPVRRFGIALKDHKSEKGRRRPGSLGPWHPARVTFRAPQAGQLGMFTRIVYNNKILKLVSEAKEAPITNIKHYGEVKTSYLILRGSIQGPSKRQLVLSPSFRPTKKQTKKQLEFIELR